MLALAFSILLTVYLIVPEAIFRFFFGFFIPTRTFTLTRTETAFRAVLISFFPFWFAMWLSWDIPGPQSWPLAVEQNSTQQRRADYKIVASALYSDAEFSRTKDIFWPALTRCTRRQARLAFWYFLLVAAEACLLGRFASRYGAYSSKSFYRWLSDRLLSPYISHWHPLLSQNILPDTIVRADILCTNDTLYQGIVSQYFLKDGDLSGIILHEPKRFDRGPYLKAKEAGENPDKNAYWVAIPSQHLYFFAEKILNMNLSYVTLSGTASPAAVQKFLSEELSPLLERRGKINVTILRRKGPSAETRKDKEADRKPPKT